MCILKKKSVLFHFEYMNLLIIFFKYHVFSHVQSGLSQFFKQFYTLQSLAVTKVLRRYRNNYTIQHLTIVTLALLITPVLADGLDSLIVSPQ